MTTYIEVPIGELFEGRNGQAKFINDYLDAHPGKNPVYSASLTRPFGFIDTFDYDGRYLTWVMNGYGGRVREVSGRFSANRDRGVFVPRKGVRIPDLTYLRFAMEGQLMAAAVGRQVDGRANDYTKIYPTTAESVLISLPLADSGAFDYARMAEIGTRLRRVEVAQEWVERTRLPLERATFPLDVPEPSLTLTLGDTSCFSLSIGDRVLKSQHSEDGVPVYSANVLMPFGHITKSNLSNFDNPSLLWGIDGTFDWNLIPAGEEFATTDHCGRLQVINDKLDPEYVVTYLRSTRERYGFDRVFRANLTNMRADVSVVVPADENGEPSLDRQRELATETTTREEAQTAALAALDDVLKARLTVEM
jgi:restriction endonuclease S subunit